MMRVDRDLHEPGDDEYRCDRDRAIPSVVEAERHEHVEDAEEQGRQRVEPEPSDERPVAERACDRARVRRLGGRGPDGEERRDERERDERDRDERPLDPHDVGKAAEHRADDEAEDGEAEDRAECLPASLARHVDGDPRQRAGPGRRARDTLDEAGQPEGDRAAGQREGEAREREHGQSGENAALRPDPADEEAARHSADQRSRAVRAEEQAGLELRQVVRVGEVGEERDDRPEQHRVEEHDRAREDDDAAHRPRIRRRPPDPRGRRHRHDAAVATATAGAFRGVPPPQAGVRAAGLRSCGIPLADQRKRTESVSPPSSSPDRPSPKRLPGGRAFNLRRSVLGALGNLLAHLAGVKHLLRDNVSQIATIAFAAAFAGEFRSTQKRTEGGGSFVRPPDRPPPKRLPVGGPSTSGAPSSVHTGHYGPVIMPSSGNRFRNPHFARFLFHAA